MTTGYCDWHKIRFETPECAKCALATWSDQRKGGCLIVFFLWPVLSLGMVVGAVWATFWSGFKVTRNIWDDSWKWVRAKKPGGENRER